MSNREPPEKLAERVLGCLASCYHGNAETIHSEHCPHSRRKWVAAAIRERDKEHEAEVQQLRADSDAVIAAALRAARIEGMEAAVVALENRTNKLRDKPKTSMANARTVGKIIATAQACIDEIRALIEEEERSG